MGNYFLDIYWVTQKLPHIYTANHATFPIRIRKLTVNICGNFWVTQYNYMKNRLTFKNSVHAWSSLPTTGRPKIIKKNASDYVRGISHA